MLIRYNGIDNEIMTDAPFIGALLKAPQCHCGCAECINEHLKDKKGLIIEDSVDIIKKIKSNGLNKGVIFGGLEWSETPKYLFELCVEAFKNNLKVIVYTHHANIDELENAMGKCVQNLKDCSKRYECEFYIKYGAYMKELTVDDNIQYTVKLATSNQYISKYN